MDKEPLQIAYTRKPVSTRTKAAVLLLIAVGWLTYAVASSSARSSDKAASSSTTMATAATAQQSTAATTQSATTDSTAATSSPAAPVRAAGGATVYPANAATQKSQILYPTQVNVLADPNEGAAPKSKMPHSTIRTEATPVVEPSEKTIPLLGPVVRESGRPAVVVPPFLMCTVEIMEHGVRVSRQTMGCTQSDEGERPAMLMEFGQEVPNALPNMKYWLSVQVDGYRKGYPILRTRMELKGLLGRTIGRRKYESVTVARPNTKHTVIAFNIDDDDFAVTVLVRKQR